MTLNRRAFHQAMAAIAACVPWSAWADARPARPSLKLLVGYPAGGSTDAVARRMADGLRTSYAQTTLVDNRPGAGGRMALNELRRAPTDGSVAVVQPEGLLTVLPHVEPLSRTMQVQDLEAVSPCAVLRMALAVGPAVPPNVRSVADFVAWAARHPAQANYATPGANTPNRFLIGQLARQAGVALNHVPYKGSAPGVIDLVGGQVAAMCSPLGDHLQYLRDGRVRILALASAQRSPLAPEIPTFQEQGFADMLADETCGMFMPKGTPTDVLQRAAQAVAEVVQHADVVQSFARIGMEPASAAPAEYAALIAQNQARWGQRIAASGFKPEL
jgi:tripartite-type tricarboxylate transporter receptor subunit TctC